MVFPRSQTSPHNSFRCGNFLLLRVKIMNDEQLAIENAIALNIKLFTTRPSIDFVMFFCDSLFAIYALKRRLI